MLSLCCSAAMAAPPDQPVPPTQPAQPEQPAQPQEGFVIVHVLPRLSPDAQRVEDRCARITTSHAATDRDSRQTKGTQGTNGECAGQGFQGEGGAEIMSGLQSPATIR
jgi:hypothetical protein